MSQVLRLLGVTVCQGEVTGDGTRGRRGLNMDYYG